MVSGFRFQGIKLLQQQLISGDVYKWIPDKHGAIKILLGLNLRGLEKNSCKCLTSHAVSFTTSMCFIIYFLYASKRVGKANPCREYSVDPLLSLIFLVTFRRQWSSIFLCQKMASSTSINCPLE